MTLQEYEELRQLVVKGFLDKGIKQSVTYRSLKEIVRRFRISSEMNATSYEIGHYSLLIYGTRVNDKWAFSLNGFLAFDIPKCEIDKYETKTFKSEYEAIWLYTPPTIKDKEYLKHDPTKRFKGIVK